MNLKYITFIILFFASKQELKAVLLNTRKVTKGKKGNVDLGCCVVALPLITKVVTMGKLFNLSMPVVFICKIAVMKVPIIYSCGENLS